MQQPSQPSQLFSGAEGSIHGLDRSTSAQTAVLSTPMAELGRSKWHLGAAEALNCDEDISYDSLDQVGAVHIGLTPAHRATAVDSTLAAALNLGLNNDTLFTAVAVLDRVLAAKPTPLPLLQPTAIACLWVAAKYEQQDAPPVGAFASLVLQYSSSSSGGDGGGGGGAHMLLTQRLLVELEREILEVLDFRLASLVTPKSFKPCFMQQLQHSKAAAGMPQRQLDRLFCLTSYLTEISLLEYSLLPQPPSKVAAAACVYAHILLGLGFSEAAQLTGYTLAQLSGLLETFCALHGTLCGALQLGRSYSVTQKYRSAQVCGVALVPPVTIPAGQRLSGW